MKTSIKKKKFSNIECFNAFLEPGLDCLNSDLILNANMIDDRHVDKQTYPSTYWVTERANNAESCITAWLTKIICDYFDFINSQYIKLKENEIEEISKIVSEKRCLLTAQEIKKLNTDRNSYNGALSQSKLSRLANNSEYFEKYIKKECAKSSLLKKSIQYKQVQIALWASITASILATISLFK